MIKFTIIIFGLLNIIYNVYSYKPRVYMRIPHHFVNDRVIQFLHP